MARPGLPPPSDQFDPTELAKFIERAMRAVRNAEILTSAVGQFQPLVGSIQRAIDADPDLRPELGATLESLKDAVDALGRAGQFTVARYDDDMKRLLAHYGVG